MSTVAFVHRQGCRQRVSRYMLQVSKKMLATVCAIATSDGSFAVSTSHSTSASSGRARSARICSYMITFSGGRGVGRWVPATDAATGVP